MDRGATLRGILERNEAAGYYLNHVTIEVDMSEVGTVDEGLEGLPISVEGRFEERDHPESGARWVFKAHSVQADVPGSSAPLSGPPPPA